MDYYMLRPDSYNPCYASKSAAFLRGELFPGIRVFLSASLALAAR
jgi:hypothetical protein